MAEQDGEERLITKPFVIVTATTFVFFLYVGVLVPTMPRLIHDRLGGGNFDVGLNLAAFSIAAIVARPALGKFGDRHGLRMMMTCGSGLAAVAAGSMALVMNRWGILPLRALQGVGEAAMFVGGATMINGFAPPHRRAEAASYFSVAIFGGLGVGPIIGETVVGDGTSHFAAGLLIAASFTALACVLTRFAPLGMHVDDDEPSLDASGVPIRRPHFHPGAFRTGAVLAAVMAGFATFNAFMPLYARDIGLSGSQWVFTTYSIACLVIRIAAAKVPERIGLVRATAFAICNVAAALFVFAASPTTVGVFSGVVFLAIGMSFLYPSLMAMTVNGVPERERVRVIATFTMFFEVGTAAGGIAFGGVAQLTSRRGGFFAGGLSAVLALWVLWRVLRPTLQRAPAAADVPVGACATT